MAVTARQLVDTSQTGRWLAGIDLRFTRHGNRTALAGRRHFGPLRVQRPFYPEGDEVCHVYLLHPPGGVVGGDELAIGVDMEAGAHALVTTPAAAKFYRSDGRAATQTQHLFVADGALLEWLPQETIVFRDARVVSTTRVHLQGSAGFAGWDMVCLGRPACGERFDAGSYRSRLEIYRDGLPLFIERPSFDGNSAVAQSCWGLAGHCVHGTFVVTGHGEDLATQVRHDVDYDPERETFTVSQLREALVCRYLGDDIERAKRCFFQALQTVRPLVHGRHACRPRIWDT